MPGGIRPFQRPVRANHDLGLPADAVRQYRLIYRTADTRVVIRLVADGRREMQAMLERRLLAR
jgi:hypothetical protein